MPPLAMHGDGDLGLYPAIELLELAAARVARDMDGCVLVGDELEAAIGEAVLHAADGLLVAGDGARGEDHPVARIELDVGMLALGDARHGRAGLALAAGAERDDIVGRKLGESPLLVKRQVGVEIAGRLRRLDDTKHGAADHHQLAAGGAGGVRHRADARDIGGEGGDRNALARLADEAIERHRHVGLRRRHPIADGIGRVADKRRQPLIAERSQPRFVGRRARQRVLIELPVAGMERGAKRRPDDHRRGLGDRMRHGDQLDIERADGAAAAHAA